MRSLLAALLAALATGCVAAPEAAPAPTIPAALERAAVADHGLVAAFLRPAGEARLPGIVVLGGSEGGLQGAEGLARPLAEQGYATLAVAYFGAAGLPTHLQEVPLSCFDRAIDWLRARPDVDPGRIAILGVSKGAEAALIVATRRSDLVAVVAGAPSDVAWQGINLQDWTPKSSWLLDTGPSPYAPYDHSRPFTSVLDLYRRSRAAHGDTGAGVIPVERIRSPILLLAGEDDTLWPAADMAGRIARRLAAHRFAHRFDQAGFPDAGHAVTGPPVTLEQAARLNSLGGTTEGNFAARQQGWKTVLRFLDETLQRR